MREKGHRKVENYWFDVLATDVHYRMPFLSRAESREELSQVKKEIKEVVKQTTEETMETGDVSNEL